MLQPITEIAREVFEAKTGWVLDLGTGTGQAIPYWRAALSGQFLGVDDGSARIPIAGPKMFRADGVYYCVGDGERLPVRDGTFDAVVLQCTSEHLRRPAAVFREVCRVLRPGGCFAIFHHGFFSAWGDHTTEREPFWAHLLGRRRSPSLSFLNQMSSRQLQMAVGLSGLVPYREDWGFEPEQLEAWRRLDAAARRAILRGAAMMNATARPIDVLAACYCLVATKEER